MRQSFAGMGEGGGGRGGRAITPHRSMLVFSKHWWLTGKNAKKIFCASRTNEYCLYVISKLITSPNATPLRHGVASAL